VNHDGSDPPLSRQDEIAAMQDGKVCRDYRAAGRGEDARAEKDGTAQTYTDYAAIRDRVLADVASERPAVSGREAWEAAREANNWEAWDKARGPGLTRAQAQEYIDARRKDDSRP
jgi:hypothetical protein